MTAEEMGKHLHDQATRGVVLATEAQALLAARYAQLDDEESRQLAGAPPLATLVELQTQVDHALAQLGATTQRIQTLAAENDQLRREVVALQRQLAQKRAVQPT